VSKDILQSIVQTEVEADKIIGQSAEEARQVVSEAERQSKLLSERIMQDAEKKARQMVLDAEKSTQQEIESFRIQVEKECGEIRRKAGEKMNDAVDFILGRVIKVHGNS